MASAPKHVLVDTNVIIEAHRTRCWRALVGHYQMDTVAKCLEECETGNRRRNTVVIDTALLKQELQPKAVTPAMILSLEQRIGGRVDLDPGEKELLAYAITLQDCWVVTSPDKAAVRAGHFLGVMDQFVSLEELATSAGERPAMKEQYTNRWLSSFKTQVLLG